MYCRHCKQGVQNKPRGLCSPCYYNGDIRQRFPKSPHWRQHGYGLERKKRPLPPTPTVFQPGTIEKVDVLADRVRKGFQLWHPLDGVPPAVDDLRGFRKTQYCFTQNKAG